MHASLITKEQGKDQEIELLQIKETRVQGPGPSSRTDRSDRPVGVLLKQSEQMETSRTPNWSLCKEPDRSDRPVGPTGRIDRSDEACRVLTELDFAYELSGIGRPVGPTGRMVLEMLRL